MKRIFAAAILSLATAAAANAATAPTIWQGDVFITSFTGPCSTYAGATVGQAIYAPAGLSGNGTNDQLALFLTQGAAHQAQPAGSATTFNGATTLNWLDITKLASINRQTGMTGELITITPAATSTTQTVTVSISKLMAAYGDGCFATMQGALSVRPGNLPN